MTSRIIIHHQAEHIVYCKPTCFHHLFICTTFISRKITCMYLNLNLSWNEYIKAMWNCEIKLPPVGMNILFLWKYVVWQHVAVFMWFKKEMLENTLFKICSFRIGRDRCDYWWWWGITWVCWCQSGSHWRNVRCSWREKKCCYVSYVWRLVSLYCHILGRFSLYFSHVDISEEIVRISWQEEECSMSGMSEG